MAGTKRKWLRRAAKVMLEVGIVFAGVWLAFWLQSERRERQTEERRQQIYRTLHREVSSLDEALDETNELWIGGFVDTFLTAYDKGRHPKPRAFLLTGSGINDDSWEAMLQAGGLDALSVDFVREVDAYYGGLEYLVELLNEFESLSNQYLRPDLDADAASFYRADTLKARYAWYDDYLRRLRGMSRGISRRSDSMLVQLEAKMDEEP